VDAYRQVLANQDQTLRMQREAMGRGRKLLAVLGLVIVIVLIIVVVLLRYMLQHYA
jgi:cell division protein FtsL